MKEQDLITNGITFMDFMPAIITLIIAVIFIYWLRSTFQKTYIKPLEDKIDGLSNNLEQKDRVIKQLSTSLIALQMEVERMADDTINFLKQKPAEPVVVSKPTKTIADFYMSTPNKDGSFSMASRSETFRPSVSIYHFMPFSETEAVFQFESDEQGLRDALNFSKSYIEPVCEEENDVTPDTKHVITLKKGSAELVEGQWKVSKKALIRYD